MATGKEVATYNRHDNIVVAAAISPDGRLVATGGRQAYPIQSGKPGPAWPEQVLDGHRRERPGRSASRHDGTAHRLGHDVRTREPQRARAARVCSCACRAPGSRSAGPRRRSTRRQNFLRARSTYGAYSLMHRKGGDFGYDAILDIKKDGKTVATIERDSTDGYDIAPTPSRPTARRIISGGANGISSAYDLKGKKIGDFIGHESDVWAVAPSRRRPLLVSGSGDQTIRLWNLKTRELIVTLFRGIDGEWVMWTPQGYYTGSPGADKIVGWQINKGAESTPPTTSAPTSCGTHLNRPDIVEKAIILASAEQADARVARHHLQAGRPAGPAGAEVPHRLAGRWHRPARRPRRGEDRHRGGARSHQGDPRAGQRPPGRRASRPRSAPAASRPASTPRRAARQGPQRGAHHAQPTPSATRPRP